MLTEPIHPLDGARVTCSFCRHFRGTPRVSREGTAEIGIEPGTETCARWRGVIELVKTGAGAPLTFRDLGIRHETEIPLFCRNFAPPKLYAADYRGVPTDAMAAFERNRRLDRFVWPDE